MTDLRILPYAFPLMLSAVMAGLTALYAGRLRSVPGAKPFVVMNLCSLIWSLCVAVSMYQTDMNIMIAISNIQGLGHAGIAPAWMIFAMRYTGRDRWISRRNLTLLCIEPALFQIMVWTDSWHGLMRVANWLSYDGPFPLHHSTFGIGYWGHVVSTYTMMLIGSVMMIHELIRSYHHMYRGQVATLAVAALTPWIANMVQLAPIDLPVPYIMLTPLGLCISNTSLAWGLFEYRLLDVVPVAREAVMDSMRDGVVVLDTRGHIVDLNATAQQTIGRTADQVIGQYAADVWPGWRHLINTAPTESMKTTVELVDSSGMPRQYEIHISPVFNRNRLRSGSLLLILDTTERMQAEEERLKISKLESLSVMATGIAHDFNNTLAGIIGYLSMAKMEVDSGTTTHEHLLLAEEAALHARILTQQMMGFAKGGAPVKNVQSVAAVLYSGGAMIPNQPAIERLWRLSSDLWPADIDAGQIVQVIQNLIVNAQQAMPGGGTITITGANETIGPDTAIPGIHLPPGPYVRIAVQDTGAGVPPEIRDRIFDPYFTTKATGTGLGLTSTFTILQRHEGAITVSSISGQGATFEFFLPARADMATPGPQTAPVTIRPSAPSKPVQGRVLVMDDEAIIRRLAQEGLTQFGYQVTCVEDGAKALDVYGQAFESDAPFDVVVMDLTIPGGMGGRETMPVLLELDPNVKVIVSSGYGNDPLMVDFQRYGFRDRMVKPYRLRDLVDMVYGVMHNHHGGKDEG